MNWILWSTFQNLIGEEKLFYYQLCIIDYCGWRKYLCINFELNAKWILMYINRIAEILLSNMCDKYIVTSFFMSSPKYTHTWAHSHTHTLTRTHTHLGARILCISYITHTHTRSLSLCPCLFIFIFLFPFLCVSLYV